MHGSVHDSTIPCMRYWNTAWSTTRLTPTMTSPGKQYTEAQGNIVCGGVHYQPNYPLAHSPTCPLAHSSTRSLAHSRAIPRQPARGTHLGPVEERADLPPLRQKLRRRLRDRARCTRARVVTLAFRFVPSANARTPRKPSTVRERESAWRKGGRERECVATAQLLANSLAKGWTLGWVRATKLPAKLHSCTAAKPAQRLHSTWPTATRAPPPRTARGWVGARHG